MVPSDSNDADDAWDDAPWKPCSEQEGVSWHEGRPEWERAYCAPKSH